MKQTKNVQLGVPERQSKNIPYVTTLIYFVRLPLPMIDKMTKGRFKKLRHGLRIKGTETVNLDTLSSSKDIKLVNFIFMLLLVAILEN